MPPQQSSNGQSTGERAEDRRKKLDEYLRQKEEKKQLKHGRAKNPNTTSQPSISKELAPLPGQKSSQAPPQAQNSPTIVQGNASECPEPDKRPACESDIGQSNVITNSQEETPSGELPKRMPPKTPVTPHIASSGNDASGTKGDGQVNSEEIHSALRQLNTVMSKASETSIMAAVTPRVEDPFFSKTPLFPFKRVRGTLAVPFPPGSNDSFWRHNPVLLQSQNCTERIRPPCMRLFSLKHISQYARQSTVDNALLHAMLLIVAAPGLPSIFDPRRHCDYWLLLAEYHERDGRLDEADRALEEGLCWKCTPMGRLLQAKDRIAQRRLIVSVAASTIPQLTDTIVGGPKAETHTPPKNPPLPSPTAEDPAYGELAGKYQVLLEENPPPCRSPQTPKNRSELISNAARIISQSARAPETSSTPSKNRQLRATLLGTAGRQGTQMVLTPLRASKRVRQEFGAELMLTPVRKSLRLNSDLCDAKDTAAEMLLTGKAVYLPDPAEIVPLYLPIVLTPVADPQEKDSLCGQSRRWKRK